MTLYREMSDPEWNFDLDKCEFRFLSTEGEEYRGIYGIFMHCRRPLSEVLVGLPVLVLQLWVSTLSSHDY
jgi:hypothetical protein